MAVARLGYEIDSSGAVVATGNLDDMSAAAVRAEKSKNALSNSAKSTSNSMFALGGAFSSASIKMVRGQTAAVATTGAFRGLGAEVADTARESRLYAQEMDAIRAKFNPLFAASKQYEHALREIADAERMGAISAREAAAARDRAAASMNATNTAAMVMGKTTKISAAHVANLGAQFNDIGVMLAAGQSPLQLAVQQGTQINQVFAQMGGGKQALKGLAAGFMSMVNPMSLATIGIIAGGAALVQWGIAALGASDEAEGLSKAMKDIEDNTKNANLELKRMQMGLASLEQVLLVERQKVLRLEILEIERAMETLSGRNLRGARLRVAERQSEIDLIQKAINEENDAIRQSDQWARSMAAVGDEVSSILSGLLSISGGVIGNAAKQSEIDALRAGKSIRDASKAAAAFKAEVEFSAREQGANMFERILIQGERYQFERGQQLDAELDAEREAARKRNSVRGGGGGVLGAGISDIEKTIEALRTQSEVVKQWYAQNKLALQMATDEELAIIGGRHEAEQRLQSEHQRRLAEINAGWHGTRLDQTQTFMGEMAAALQSGNSKMQAAAQVFASVEALINAYRAYNQVLADPTLPAFAKIPAAFAVLSAGLKTVSSIKSLSGGGGSGSSAGVTAGSSGSGAAPQTRAIISVQGGRTRFSVEEYDDIIRAVQGSSGDGVIIEGFVSA